MSMEQFKVPEEIALNEVKDFVEYHLDKEVTKEDISNGYEDTVKAVMRGLLDISDHKAPVLTLREPVLNTDGNTSVSIISFLTRIKPTALASLSKGIDISKDQLSLVNRMTSYLIQQPAVAMLDRFGKTDYKIIQQVTGLFQ